MVGNRQRGQQRHPVGVRSGFSLIELLAVLVIIGVLIGLAVPAITNLSRSTALPGALREVANEAGLARQYAITHRIQTEMRVSSNFTAVTVFTNVGPNEVQLDKWNYLPVGTVVFLDASIPTTTCVTNLVFTPTGGTTNINEVYICAREGSFENGVYFGTNINVGTITVNNMLGRIATVRR